MRVLFVEDQAEFHSALRDVLEPQGIAVDLATHADAAVRAIDACNFDLLLCDLKIPASEGVPDAHKAHGIRVFDYAQVAVPGIPIVIVSAYGELADLGDRLAATPTQDLYGQGSEAMVMERKKSQLTQVIDIVCRHRDELQSLTVDIEISGPEARAVMSDLDARLIAIHARKRDGVIARVNLLTQGHSGALTMRVDVEKQNGVTASRGVAKLNSLVEIEDERERYGTYVAPVLDAAAYADCLEVVRAGARDRGGLFYSLAGGYNESLFEVLRRSPDDAAQTVAALRESVSPWQSSAAAESLSVADVRKMFVREERLTALADPDAVARTAEERSVNVRAAPCHGDLHGGNVLVNGANAPILIDFGRVREGVNAVDPVTLELSVVLHPQSGIELDDWPSVEQARRWSDLAFYTEDCPVGPFVKACREWALEVGRGEREIDAVVYGFALRQLLFPEIDHTLAAAYCEGATARITT